MRRRCCGRYRTGKEVRTAGLFLFLAEKDGRGRDAGLTAEQVIAQDQAGEDDEHGKDSVVHKEHDRHSDRYPEEDETKHSFHGWPPFAHKLALPLPIGYNVF